MNSPIVVPITGSASSAVAGTYAALLKDVAEWLNRTDLAERIPSFVKMAESEFSRDQRLRSAFLTSEASGYTSHGEFALPDDLLELKELRFNGCILQEITFEEGRRASGGHYFHRRGGVAVVAGQSPGQWSLVYTQKLPALMFDSDSNWLLRDGYDLYLWKCCEVGSGFLRDPEGAQGYKTKYEQSASEMVAAINSQEFGGASLSVRTPGVV
jgi:hypothetical protein